MDKLELFNELIEVVSPVNSRCAYAAGLNEPLPDTGLDSLDLLMMSIYLSDLYGVPEEVLKTMQPITVQDMLDFMEQHKTKELPATVQEAIDSVK
jgi:hypothetical protein